MYKLIVVEDELIIRRGIVNGIPWHDLGYEVVGQAANGLEAIDLIKENQPDVVLSDISMPKMDGVELMKYINTNHPDIKVIILSGYNDFEYLKEAVKNNVVDYILKPTDEESFNQLFRKTKKALDEKEAHKTYIHHLEFSKNMQTLERFLDGTEHYEECPLTAISDVGYVVVLNIDKALDQEKETILNRLRETPDTTYYINHEGLLVGLTKNDPEPAFRSIYQHYNKLSGGVSQCVTTWKTFPKTYLEAKQALKHSPFNGTYRWSSYESLLLSEGYSPLIQEILRIIDRDYKKNWLSLDYLSEKVGKSTSYISKVFKRETGYNFTSYVSKKRLEEAKRQLKDISIKIYEIAENVGFTDASVFIKSFKKIYGMSPGDYRMEHRNEA